MRENPPNLTGKRGITRGLRQGTIDLRTPTNDRDDRITEKLTSKRMDPISCSEQKEQTMGQTKMASIRNKNAVGVEDEYAVSALDISHLLRDVVLFLFTRSQTMDHSVNEPHLDITVDENDIVEGAKEIVRRIRPSWPGDQLLFKVFTDGLTNKLIGVWYPGHYNEMVLVRVYGHKTDLLIDRKDETRNIRILNKAGYTHSIYATFNNGLAYQFLEGETLTTETVRSPEVYWLIAKRMAQMHKLRPDHQDISKEPVIWSKTEKFMSIMPKEFSDPCKQARFEKLIKPYAVLEQEYTILKERLSELGSPVVYAHNDLLLGNVLYNRKENSVTFIDYEYTAYNYQAFDIANHFAEFAGIDNPDYSLYPEESLQRSWLKIYLQAYNESSNVSEKDITRLYHQVNQFVLLAHFFWGCWSLIQSLHSSIDFDFLEYAATRFNEYDKRKQEYFK